MKNPNEENNEKKNTGTAESNNDGAQTTSNQEGGTEGHSEAGTSSSSTSSQDHASSDRGARVGVHVRLNSTAVILASVSLIFMSGVLLFRTIKMGK